VVETFTPGVDVVVLPAADHEGHYGVIGLGGREREQGGEAEGDE
jgi:hypothetical protein